eukprot:1157842-Pelagomonas_calceolata.AAC.4
MLASEIGYVVVWVQFDVLRLLSDYATSKCSLAELMEFDSSLPSKNVASLTSCIKLTIHI